MENKVNIASPRLLEIPRADGGVYSGASQEWFRSYWKRLSGCGPTTGSNLVWYLTAARPDLAGLWDCGARTKADMVRLMDTMFDYIKPTMRGVNSTALFRDGAMRFAWHRRTPLLAEVLDIPAGEQERPNIAQVREFLAGAFAEDLPVAFLNLSNGKVRNLDKWHWVTLTGLDVQLMHALMYDAGRSDEIDLGLWLETTTLGGGFVVLRPEKVDNL